MIIHSSSSSQYVKKTFRMWNSTIKSVTTSLLIFLTNDTTSFFAYFSLLTFCPMMLFLRRIFEKFPYYCTCREQFLFLLLVLSSPPADAASFLPSSCPGANSSPGANHHPSQHVLCSLWGFFSCTSSNSSLRNLHLSLSFGSLLASDLVAKSIEDNIHHPLFVVLFITLGSCFWNHCSW